MLALTPAHPIPKTREWPYKSHAVLIAHTHYELTQALEGAEIMIALAHSGPVPHAHVTREGADKLHLSGVPYLNPAANDALATRSQSIAPLTEPD